MTACCNYLKPHFTHPASGQMMMSQLAAASWSYREHMAVWSDIAAGQQDER